MTTKLDHLRALARICRRLGGRLAILSQHAFYDLFDHRDRKNWEGLTEAPFTDAHGIHWREKTVYAVRGREEVGSIIHEMGHVFAAQHHPECYCGECHEWSWFGWEVAIARQIGATRTWSRHNANYQTRENGGGQWSKLSADQRRTVVTKSLARARKLGLVGDNGEPRSLR